MYLEDIPGFIEFSEVSDKVTEIVLASCDVAEFLGAEKYGLQDINDLRGTKYEDIIPAFISVKTGDSYGMTGKLFRFRLTEEVRSHILEESLVCIFSYNNAVYLENLCLYFKDKVIFSCVSHEFLSLYHMAEIDDSLGDAIYAAIEETMQKMPLYETMKKAVRRANESATKMEKELQILFDLCWYVDEEKGMWVYTPPKYKCDLNLFKEIAKKYLTEETFAPLAAVNSFSELQPLPVAKTVEEALHGKGSYAPQFMLTEYYNTVKYELSILECVIGLEKAKNNN